MLLRSLVALSLLINAPATPQTLDPSHIDDAIVRVICINPINANEDEISAGTAFRVGNGVMLSVAHVTSAPGQCFVGREPMRPMWTAPKADFSMLHTDSGAFLTVDCGGFVKGRRYLALGYARGLPKITTVELVGTGQMDDGQAVLAGIFSVVPGMSGGAVLDEETGKVVGTINAEDFRDGLSWSVPLSSTPVCKPRIA